MKRCAGCVRREEKINRAVSKAKRRAKAKLRDTINRATGKS